MIKELELIKNVNDRKLASVPDASFLFYLVFFNILITLSRMFV